MPERQSPDHASREPRPKKVGKNPAITPGPAAPHARRAFGRLAKAEVSKRQDMQEQAAERRRSARAAELGRQDERLNDMRARVAELRAAYEDADDAVADVLLTTLRVKEDELAEAERRATIEPEVATERVDSERERQEHDRILLEVERNVKSLLASTEGTVELLESQQTQYGFWADQRLSGLGEFIDTMYLEGKTADRLMQTFLSTPETLPERLRNELSGVVRDMIANVVEAQIPASITTEDLRASIRQGLVEKYKDAGLRASVVAEHLPAAKDAIRKKMRTSADYASYAVRDALLTTGALSPEKMQDVLASFLSTRGLTSEIPAEDRRTILAAYWARGTRPSSDAEDNTLKKWGIKPDDWSTFDDVKEQLGREYSRITTANKEFRFADGLLNKDWDAEIAKGIEGGLRNATREGVLKVDQAKRRLDDAERALQESLPLKQEAASRVQAAVGLQGEGFAQSSEKFVSAIIAIANCVQENRALDTAVSEVRLAEKAVKSVETLSVDTGFRASVDEWRRQLRATSQGLGEVARKGRASGVLKEDRIPGRARDKMEKVDVALNGNNVQLYEAADVKRVAAEREMRNAFSNDIQGIRDRVRVFREENDKIRGEISDARITLRDALGAIRTAARRSGEALGKELQDKKTQVDRARDAVVAAKNAFNPFGKKEKIAAAEAAVQSLEAEVTRLGKEIDENGRVQNEANRLLENLK